MSSKPEGGLTHYEAPAHAFKANLQGLQAEFPRFPGGLSWKSSKGKKIATIASDDPVATATRFSGLASSGYVSEAKLPNGYVRKLADNSTVTLRLTSSSDGSPAVDLNIAREGHIRKIHFTRRKHG